MEGELQLRQHLTTHGLSATTGRSGLQEERAQEKDPAREAGDCHVAGRQKHPFAAAYGDHRDVAQYRSGQQEEHRRKEAERAYHPVRGES
ncbi:MAG: hypothetical protein JWM95_4236 [Gemmatimonadetes bacterium]|nr:hypothetical protein [Gemmatimonadota bacterium]